MKLHELIIEVANSSTVRVSHDSERKVIKRLLSTNSIECLQNIIDRHISKHETLLTEFGVLENCITYSHSKMNRNTSIVFMVAHLINHIIDNDPLDDLALDLITLQMMISKEEDVELKIDLCAFAQYLRKIILNKLPLFRDRSKEYVSMLTSIVSNMSFSSPEEMKINYVDERFYFFVEGDESQANLPKFVNKYYPGLNKIVLFG